jgi:hypothetical protein
MEKALKARKNKIYDCRSQISSFRRKGGISSLLPRHSGDRFFVIVDFVHAFHQITREIMAEVFTDAQDKYFDICFVELGGRMVLPIGALTSSYLFEMYMSRAIDHKLMSWQSVFDGHVSRHADNILATWRKNTGQELPALLEVFFGFEVRVTPQKPRLWKGSDIRFCGLVFPFGQRPRVSQRKKRRVLEGAQGKSTEAIDGAISFVDNKR